MGDHIGKSSELILPIPPPEYTKCSISGKWHVYSAIKTVNQLFRAHAFLHIVISHGLRVRWLSLSLGRPAHSEERGAKHRQTQASTGKLGAAEATCIMRTGGVGCGRFALLFESIDSVERDVQ